jgi:iron complex transport system substrate-binding protein
LALLTQTELLKDKPTVFVGMPWNGAWYVPGGKSFQAQLFKDAGAKYLWADNEEKSSLVKAKEVIIDVAFDANYWLNQNSYQSIADLVAFDEKFNSFSAIKNQDVYNNDNRSNALSGNDYSESGVVQPDVVLRDLIEIFHPELLDHELYYYRKLE